MENPKLEEGVIGAIKFQDPKMQGLRQFLHMGECPKDLDKVQRQHLVTKAALDVFSSGRISIIKGRTLF